MRILIDEDIFSSRFNRAVTQIRTQAAASSSAYHVKSKGRCATVTFDSIGACRIAVARLGEKLEAGGRRYPLMIGDKGSTLVDLPCRCKHDEPWPVRRKKFVSSRAWLGIPAVYTTAFPFGPKLNLKADHTAGRISAEFMPGLRLRPIVFVHDPDDNGYCRISAIDAILELQGFNGESIVKIQQFVDQAIGQ